MDSIRKGAALKVMFFLLIVALHTAKKYIFLRSYQKVDTSTLSTGSGGSNSDNRTDLLSEIRQGVELRSAANRELGAQRDSSGAGTDALADALRRALQERGRAIRSSDEDDDDSSENDGEWDD